MVANNKLNNVLTVHEIIHGKESSSQNSDRVKFESGGGAMNKVLTRLRRREYQVLAGVHEVQGHIAALAMCIYLYNYIHTLESKPMTKP